MSSAKRRTQTSNYASLTAELGFSSGYKTWGSENDDPSYSSVPVEYYLEFKENGKTITSGSFDNNESTNSFNLNDQIFFFIGSNWALPSEFKKNYCSQGPRCTVDKIKSLNLMKSDNYYFVVNYTTKNGKADSFKIILVNGAELTSEDDWTVGKVELEKMANVFSTQKLSNYQYFAEKVNLIIGNCEKVVKTYQRILSIFNKEKKRRDLEYNEAKKTYEKYVSDKQKLEQEIKALNDKIAARDIEISNTLSDKEKCINEHISLVKELNIEEIIYDNAVKKKAEDLAKLRAEKAQTIKRVFYFLEASYFFRVFAEKLIKAEADVSAALTGAHIKTTEQKLAKAFYPIKVQFANSSGK
jgi:hypothetical protein